MRLLNYTKFRESFPFNAIVDINMSFGNYGLVCK